MCFSFRRLIAAVVVCLFSAIAVAQTAGTGTITGRVYNPASGGYVRNAQVRVEGSTLSAVSEDGGNYRLTDVPAGDAIVVVTFTGYRPATATVRVTPGGTATRDFEIVSALQVSGPDSTVKLDKFVVSSEREGNAKAIMEQKNSMNITNTVASDVFGDVAEGNVGEFLKHMPGIELDLVQGEVRTIRLRGLASEYTQVTLDGVSLASADANQGASGNARAFSFEQVSLASMDSIEVSKTISADVDANAPAGTINLRTKRAFDLSRRRISAQANVTAFSTRFNLDNSYGPDDRQSHKIHPGGIFDYADSFFNRRLGLSLNVSESMAYSANARTTVTYNYGATPADPRPVVPTAITFLHAPRTNRRSTVNFTSDFRATPKLTLFLTLLYNYADLNNPQRSLTFNSGARNTVVGADPMLSFTTNNTAANVVSNPAAIVKLGQTMTAIPKFEFRQNDLLVEGRFSGSNSISWYDPRGRRGSLRDAGGPVLTGLTYSASRSNLRSADWHVVQTAGPDMASGASFTLPAGGAFNLDDGRSNITDVYSGDITATYRTTVLLPIVWKAGIKRRYEIRDFRLDTESLRYIYPARTASAIFADYKSPFDFDMGATNTTSSIRSVSGGTIWMPDLVRLGGFYRDNQSQFAQVITPTNFYNAFIANRRNYEETIDGGFLMGTATLGKAIMRVGLRRENTYTDALEFDPRSPLELARAGVAETGGRATTIDGLKYQYFSKPKVHREGSYGSWFPSASLKYRVNPNLDLQFGFSSTIRRPTFRDVAGVWVINDDAVPQPTVDLPNPRLRPETSRNYSARVAYYFEPVGQFAVSAFQNTVKGLFIATSQSAAEFGYNGDLDLSNYLFRSTSQSSRRVLVRGMEYEYSQSLSFLPHPFKGLNVRASYTRNYAEIPTVNMIPHSINAGVAYTLRRVNVYANLNWRDNYPNVIATTATGTNRFYRHRANIDIGGGYRISERYNFFVSARNIFNEPYLIMERVGANPAAVQFTEVNGINWTFGVKGVW